MINYRTFQDLKVGDKVYQYEKIKGKWTTIIYKVKADDTMALHLDYLNGTMSCFIVNKKNVPFSLEYDKGWNLLFADKLCLEEMKDIIEKSFMF